MTRNFEFDLSLFIIDKLSMAMKMLWKKDINKQLCRQYELPDDLFNLVKYVSKMKVTASPLITSQQTADKFNLLEAIITNNTYFFITTFYTIFKNNDADYNKMISYLKAPKLTTQNDGDQLSLIIMKLTVHHVVQRVTNILMLMQCYNPKENRFYVFESKSFFHLDSVTTHLIKTGCSTL